MKATCTTLHPRPIGQERSIALPCERRSGRAGLTVAMGGHLSTTQRRRQARPPLPAQSFAGVCLYILTCQSTIVAQILGGNFCSGRQQGRARTRRQHGACQARWPSPALAVLAVARPPSVISLPLYRNSLHHTIGTSAYKAKFTVKPCRPVQNTPNQTAKKLCRSNALKRRCKTSFKA